MLSEKWFAELEIRDLAFQKEDKNIDVKTKPKKRKRKYEKTKNVSSCYNNSSYC